MEKEVGITGRKVLLRAAEEQDRVLLLGLIQDPEIVKVTKGYRSPVFGGSPQDGVRFLQVPAGCFRRVIADREHPESGLGIIQLSDLDGKSKTAQIHIKLLKSARGRGYGRDAVNILVSYAFEDLLLDSIRSCILENNTASRRLFEACGFRLEEMHKSSTDRDGRSRKVCTYVRRKRGGRDADHFMKRDGEQHGKQ